MYISFYIFLVALRRLGFKEAPTQFSHLKISAKIIYTKLTLSFYLINYLINYFHRLYLVQKQFLYILQNIYISYHKFYIYKRENVMALIDITVFLNIFIIRRRIL